MTISTDSFPLRSTDDRAGSTLPADPADPFEPDPGGAERGGAFGGRSLFSRPGSPWPANQTDRLRRAGSIEPSAYPLVGDEAKDAYAALDALVNRLNGLSDAYELVAADQSDEEREIARADREAVEAGEELGKVERTDWAAKRDALRRTHGVLFEGLSRAASAYGAALKADLPLQARALAEAVPAALERARKERTIESLAALLSAKMNAEAAYHAVQSSAGHKLTYGSRVNGAGIVAIRDGIAAAARLLEEGNPVDTGAWTLDTDPADAWPPFRRAMVAAGNSENAVMELLSVELGERGTVTRHMERLYSRFGAAQGYGTSWGPGSNDAVTKVW